MVSATALLLYLFSLLLNAASQRLNVYLVYSNSGTYNSTPALSGATDAIAAFSSELLPQYSLNITALDDKVLLYFTAGFNLCTHSLIVQCFKRITRNTSVRVSPVFLCFHRRRWLSFKHISTPRDCRIPQNTSCECQPVLASCYLLCNNTNNAMPLWAGGFSWM